MLASILAMCFICTFLFVSSLGLLFVWEWVLVCKVSSGIFSKARLQEAWRRFKSGMIYATREMLRSWKCFKAMLKFLIWRTRPTPKNEQSRTLDLDSELLMNLSQEDAEKYRKQLLQRRILAHNQDFQKT